MTKNKIWQPRFTLVVKLALKKGEYMLKDSLATKVVTSSNRSVAQPTLEFTAFSTYGRK